MSTEVATRTASSKDLRVMIQSDTIREQLMMALPRYYTPEQFTVIVRTAINKNPKLAECEPTSFFTSMLTAAQMGILPNNRDGHLIPRWNNKASRLECTFQPDYKGIVGLIRRNEEVLDVYAVVVRKNDVFKIVQGLHRDIVHEPDVTKPRGEIIGVYAVIAYKNGTTSWDFLSREDVESVRERSESWKAHKSKGYDTPWITDEGEMFKKTAIKRVSKLADLAPDTMDRLMSDPEITFERPAAVAEIKAASIPAAPVESLPAPEPEQPEPAQEEKPAAAAEVKAKPAKGSKLEKKAVATETTPAPEPKAKKPVEDGLSEVAKEAMGKLEYSGHSVADLIRVCQANEWLAKEFDAATTPLSAISDDDLKNLIDDENWPTVLDEIKAAKAAK